MGKSSNRSRICAHLPAFAMRRPGRPRARFPRSEAAAGGVSPSGAAVSREAKKADDGEAGGIAESGGCRPATGGSRAAPTRFRRGARAVAIIMENAPIFDKKRQIHGLFRHIRSFFRPVPDPFERGKRNVNLLKIKVLSEKRASGEGVSRNRGICPHPRFSPTPPGAWGQPPWLSFVGFSSRRDATIPQGRFGNRPPLVNGKRRGTHECVPYAKSKPANRACGRAASALGCAASTR